MCTIKHALWFKEAGYKILGVCLTGSPLEKAFQDHAITHLSLKSRGYFSLKDSLLLRRFLKEEGANVIFSHHLKDLWRIRIALLGLKHIQLIGFARMFLKNVNKKDLLHRWIYKRMETLVSLTEIQKQALMKCLPVPSDHIKVIPDSVDTKIFHPEKRSEPFRHEVFGLSGNEVAIGLVGRIDPQKGSREFVKAAAELLSRRPELKFFLIGKETPDTPGFEKSLKDYVSSKNLESKIVFLGHRSDVDQVIGNLDLFVMPSYEETFGDVLIEAMSCGVPAIATRAGGPINIVDEEQNGLLVPPKDSPALAEAIERLLSDQDLYKRLSENGREKALKVYDEKLIFKEIESLINRSPGK